LHRREDEGPGGKGAEYQAAGSRSPPKPGRANRTNVADKGGLLVVEAIKLDIEVSLAVVEPGNLQ
jgi:hypothetical protein